MAEAVGAIASYQLGKVKIVDEKIEKGRSNEDTEETIHGFQSTIGAREADIEKAKGLAILLVVWGHLASATFFNFPIAFFISVSVIYSFHMPLFMYLSGYVFFYSGHPARFWQRPGRYIIRRADRLVLPFLIIGFSVALGKYLLKDFGDIPDPVRSLQDGVLSIVYNMPGNPSASIWYLLVVFVYSIMTPIIFKIVHEKSHFLVAFGLSLWLIEVPDLFYINRIFDYFVFFAIGGFCASNKLHVLRIFSNYMIYFFSLFVILVWKFYDSEYALLICGISSIPAIHGLMLNEKFGKEKILRYIGGKTMPIYLFNTILIGMINLLFQSIFSEGEFHLYLLLITFLIALIVPIIIQEGMGRFALLRPIVKYLG